MTGQPSSLSPALAAAQAQLIALRQQHSQLLAMPTAVSDAGRPTTDDGQAPPPTVEIIAQLPAHLGWGSAVLTAVLRPQKTDDRRPTTDDRRSFVAVPHAPQPKRLPSTETITLYPTLALAMLRQKQVGVGRVWLLLRHLDEAGRGWVAESEARQRLTAAEGKLRICGWRQLRNVLAQGEGVFWQRENGRLWLRNTAKVAAALGVEQFNGRCVSLPLESLIQPIGTVRAHFYASFHSSRGHGGHRQATPIARATLTSLSGRQRQTQRHYEAKTRIQSRVNIALGQRLNATAQEETSWQHGNAAFVLHDVKGKHGPKNATYLAWQLPNSYQGPHATVRKSRQKRLNRQLADLLTDGTTGNGRCQRRYGVLGKQRHASYWSAPASSSTQIWFPTASQPEQTIFVDRIFQD